MWNLDGLPPDTIQLIERNTHEPAQAYPDMRGSAVKSHYNGYLQVIEPSHRKFNTTPTCINFAGGIPSGEGRSTNLSTDGGRDYQFGLEMAMSTSRPLLEKAQAYSCLEPGVIMVSFYHIPSGDYCKIFEHAIECCFQALLLAETTWKDSWGADPDAFFFSASSLYVRIPVKRHS